MIRVAIGTAKVLGLTKVKMDAPPTTAHFMTPGRCIFDCKFCTQAKTSTSNQNLLSRISWPEFEDKGVFMALKQRQDKFKRVCLQVVHSEEHEDFLDYVKKIKDVCTLPISVDLKADDIDTIRNTFNAGADVVGLPIDAANPKVYSEIKDGSLSSQMDLIKKAAKEFQGKISTHLMIGLGESERDAVWVMREMHKQDVITALFAFTPMKGTPLEKMKQPAIEHYRRIQMARYLIYNYFITNINFDERGRITGFGLRLEELKNKIHPIAFQTSGCPGCNRPYYNERPSGVMYNYPYEPSKKEHEKALQDALSDLR